MKRALLFVSGLVIGISSSLNGQNPTVVINEIIADNSQGILDEFGETSDWFELYNFGASSINLEGYSLTDDPNDSAKWIFPYMLLMPGQYLLIYASGRDVFNLPVDWSTVIDQGDQWSYLVPDASTVSEWKASGFNDSNWNLGISGFGYGDGDDSTLVSEGTVSIYLRKTFTIENLADIERAILHVDYDDAFVAYINGTEICRANIGISGTDVAFDQPASNANHEAKMYGGGKPEAFFIDDIKNIMLEGDNVLAIEVHNAGSGSSDLTIIPFLTLGFNTFSGNPDTNPILDLPGSSIHTNFKLSRGGEFLGLCDSNGEVVDSLTFGPQKTDVSFGRSVDGMTTLGYFATPTPGAENGSVSFAFSSNAIFSTIGGFYSAPQIITLSSENISDQIFYTSDGTIPDSLSNLYTGPITFDTTTVLRVRVFGAGKIPSDVVTQTYFINEQVNLPFISLVTDPDNLFSNERGIYITGTNGKSGSCDATVRNLNQDWERPVNLEIYNMSGEMELNQVAGIKIFGGCSRTRYPQKSFSLFARSEYGQGSFKAQLFPDKDIHEFESFILRSSADDQRYTMIKDAFAQYVQIEHMDIDYQAYRPAVVFINGEYWGIHNMREKINEHYLSGNYNTDPDDVNILQSNAGASHGSNTWYQAMMDYARNNSMSNHENYKHMRSRIDVNQYIDYQIANIYLAEVDWPGNNIKFWNSNSQYHNKWRWITFDRDQTFLSHRIQTNALSLATATDAPGWPNPPWSTLLFRRLLTNEDFRDQFIQLYAYHLNMTFKPERINGFVDSFKARIEDEIPRHISKWGGKVDPDMNESWTAGPTFSSVGEWESNLREIKTFASDRPYFAIQHLNSKFGLEGMAHLELNANDQDAGKIKIYNKEIAKNGYSGDHFLDAKLVLKAISNSGYQFSYWEISTGEKDTIVNTPRLEFSLSEATSITANFEQVVIGELPQVIINEINYNSPDNLNAGDWLEIYNNSDEIIDMENWRLFDEDNQHVFVFPHDIELDPRSYLVVCERVEDFKKIHPDVSNIIGDLEYKFSNGGEVLRLLDENMRLVDSVRYSDNKPWPEKADGDGPTLELIHPDEDNDVPDNWMAFYDLGTPGRVNSTITSVNEIGANSNDVSGLSQNFPNPADQFTTISYSISGSARATLRIQNVLGSTSRVLIDEFKRSGTYSIRFDTFDLPEGVYIYMLQVDGVAKASKKIMIRH